MRWAAACMLVLWMLCVGCLASDLQKDSDVLWGQMHTIVPVECSAYFYFQVMALALSHKRVGQPGAFTRIMACAEEDLKSLSQEDVDMVATHITPQYHVDLETGDYYPPYNKPAGILHWLENARPREEWVLMVDPDVLFRRPLSPETMYVKDGWARAAHHTYMADIHKGLSEKYIPEVEPRKDKIGGAEGRRADEAGSYYYLRTRDMERIAPLWLNITKAIRLDPDAGSLTGRDTAEKIEPQYVSEMYGYVFGAAKSDVWHILNVPLQGNIAFTLYESPALVHYTWDGEVENYKFAKRDFVYFNYTKCPPWNMQPDRKDQDNAGLIPHPPFPHEVSEKNPKERYRLMMIIEVANTINQALCERHFRMCEGSRQLIQECNRGDIIRAALDREFKILEDQTCHDYDPIWCNRLKERGNCEADPLDMGQLCRQTCEICSTGREKGSQNSSQSGVEKAAMASEGLEAICKKMSMKELVENVECLRWAEEEYGLSSKVVQHGPEGAYSYGQGVLAAQLTVFCSIFLLVIAYLRSRLKQRIRTG